MIRVGLAGFSQGYYATEYMSYLERFKEISVAAVCDCGESEEYVKECAFTTAQTFSEKMKAPLVHDYEEFLQCELDAVLICSETADHVRMAKPLWSEGFTYSYQNRCAFLRMTRLCWAGRHTTRFCCAGIR